LVHILNRGVSNEVIDSLFAEVLRERGTLLRQVIFGELLLSRMIVLYELLERLLIENSVGVV
jgi:hypothetical protein